MDCNSCRSKVEKALNCTPEVQATFTLEAPLPTITMQKDIPVVLLQETLSAAGNYSIEMNNSNAGTLENIKSLEVKSCCNTKEQYDNDGASPQNNIAAKYH